MTSAAGANTHTISRRSTNGPRRLSFPQQRMFLLDQILPGLPAYSVPTLFRVCATLDAETLRRTFEFVVGRHEILRTAISLIDGTPMQEALPPMPFELVVVDLRSATAAEREARARDILGEIVRRPFDLSGDVLLRAALIHMTDGEDQLLVVLHHIASDHVSTGLLLAELASAYGAIATGREPELPELAVQYADFAEWQREHLAGELLDELVQYWREQLGGAPERLELPTDRPRPSALTYRGAWHESTIAAELVTPLRELARRQGVSLFMVLLAGFEVLLHRYTGAEDLVVGTPVSGRHLEEIAPLLGFFSNTIALRTRVAGDPTFAELLERVRVTLLGALAHQELPFEKLVEVLNPERARSHSPIFQILFGYDMVAARERTFAGASIEQLPVPGWESARFELSMIVHDLPDGSLHMNTGYSTDIFDAATIDRLIGHLRTVWSAAARDSDQRLSALPLLTAEERRMMAEWNTTAESYDRRCLHELFASQTARRPEGIAVQSGDERITYRELDRRSNKLARELAARGVAAGQLVGICLDRSIELLVAMLGVLKAGAAYVPIEPSYPPARQEFMLADARVSVLLTQLRYHGTVDPRGASVLCLDRDWSVIDTHSGEPVAIVVDPEQLAYVIYTSGSTGDPKGVEVRHRSVANLVGYMRERPGLGELDVLANITTPAFDLSVPDWYLPLASGARLVIVTREATLDGVELADWLARVGATFVQATPTTWQMLVDAGWQGSASLKIVCGGEPLSRALADQLLRRGASLWHMYGPTETTVWSSVVELGPSDGTPPLGGPIANTTFHVVDENLQPVPIGIAGELLIGGDGVARGYHERSELTAEKFIADPSGVESERLYRTGDLVRWRPHGTLEFVGRLDQQVKLRGFRIELEEIEALLHLHPGIGAAVATVREDIPGDRRLVAYYVPSGDGVPDLEELRRLLQSRLPPFMVPSSFVTLGALPVTANGKLDRRALPAPQGGRPQLRRAYAPAESPVEEELASIWCEVLGIDRVGIHDDFFDLGGHSMLGVKMVARVRDAFGVDLQLGRLFDFPTIHGLAAAVTRQFLAEASEDELAGLLAEDGSL